MTSVLQSDSRLLRTAFGLSVFTIVYNILEGAASTYFGASDETLALFGFGLDSFVEVLSGVGIAHMIRRINNNPSEERDQFETTALKITGIAFYLLTAGLIVGASLSIITKAEPQTTLAGIIISLLSLVTMYFLYTMKMRAGRALRNEAIISDAHCTKTCFYLSFILLASSISYELFQIPYVDAIGSLGIAWYAWKEGKEAFEKARLKKLSCGDCCD